MQSEVDGKEPLIMAWRPPVQRAVLDQARLPMAADRAARRPGSCPNEHLASDLCRSCPSGRDSAQDEALSA